MFRLPIEPTADNGLQASCRLMVDKVTAVPRTRLGKRIGVLTRDELKALNRALFVFLGLSQAA
jgi:mRNA interferase MazF